MHFISSHSYYQEADFATLACGTPGWVLILFLTGCRARVLKPLPISNLRFFSLKKKKKKKWLFKIFANPRDPFLRGSLLQKWHLCANIGIGKDWYVNNPGGYSPWKGVRGCAPLKTLFSRSLSSSLRPPFQHVSVLSDPIFSQKKKKRMAIFLLRPF